MGWITASSYQFYVCELVRQTHGCYRFNSKFCRQHGGCFIKPTMSFAEGKRNFWRARRVIWPALKKEVKHAI